MSRIAVITSTKVQSPTSSVLHEKYSSPKIPVVTSNKSSSGAYDNLLRVEQVRAVGLLFEIWEAFCV